MAVAIGAFFILWMTSLSRIVLFALLFGGLVYLLSHLNGSFELRFNEEVLVSRDDSRAIEAIRRVLAGVVLLIGIVLFRLVANVRRRWVGRLSVALAVGTVAFARFTAVGISITRQRTGWLLLVVVAALALPPLVERAADAFRRRRQTKRRRRSAEASIFGSPPFE